MRARRWSLTTASFVADLAVYTILCLGIWLLLPALVLGWTPVMVASGSMSPAINAGDLVLLDPDIPQQEWYVPGTIVTFQDILGMAEDTDTADGETREQERLVTHRVERVEIDAGTYITRGDANVAADPVPVEPQQLVGAARLLIPWLGLPAHWARSGELLNLGLLLGALIGCVVLRTREQAVQQLAATREVGIDHTDVVSDVSTDAQSDVSTDARSDTRSDARPVDDVTALGARAARAAHAAGKSALASQPPPPEEEQTDRRAAREAGSPPASSWLLIIALTAGLWAGAAVPPSQAAFAAGSASTGNTFTTAPAQDIDVEVDIVSDWGASYCANVTVSTPSPTPIEWTIEIDLSTFPLNGVPYEVWNASTDLVDEILVAAGLGWNDTVVAGSPVTWGFCANRPAPPLGSAQFEVEIYDDWGSGYCANVTVSTESQTPITWQVDVDLSAFPLNGTPYTTWSATTSFSDGVLTAVGDDWDSSIVAGSPTTWGFCANRSADDVPSTSLILRVAASTEVARSQGGQTSTTTFPLDLADDLYLAGPASVELRVQRVNPNGNAERSIAVSLRADGEPLASGAASFGPGDAGWFTSTIALSPDTIALLPAGTELTVEVAAVRMVLAEGDASRLVLPGG